jgi:hypothetical protein
VTSGSLSAAGQAARDHRLLFEQQVADRQRNRCTCQQDNRGIYFRFLVPVMALASSNIE